MESGKLLGHDRLLGQGSRRAEARVQELVEDRSHRILEA
jgi:hypothetical protein